MADNDRATLFGKLNTVAYKAMEAAARTCKMRGNPYLELAHWVEGLAKQDGGGTGSAPAQNDLHALIRAFDLDVSNLSRDITAALDKFPRGGSTAELSMTLEDAIERGWLYASLRHSRTKLRSGDVILGMLMTSHLRPQLFAVSEEFKKIKRDELEANYNKHLGDSDEASAAGSATMADGAVPGEASGAVAPAAMGKQEALQRFTVDLTEQAKTGEMDPVVGRDEEVRQIIDILMRRRQNNPILVGEAGVGKTAVVEGFALRIASGDVPPPLQGVRLLSLDIGLLQAGASMKGEFEQRLRDVIDEVQQSETPIILFIDEAHTLVGAGGQAGTGDAANLLKPALARGKLRTVAATHLGRVQEAHRERPRPHAAVPDGDDRPARRAPRHPDDARHRRGARGAPPRAGARRGDRGECDPQPPLHPGAAVARQERQPARHRLRPRGRRPARDAGRGRGQPPPHRNARNRA